LKSEKRGKKDESERGQNFSRGPRPMGDSPNLRKKFKGKKAGGRTE